MRFKNRRTGNVYRVLAIGTDCTNSRDGTPVVVYCPEDDLQQVFVRDLHEFVRKFKRKTRQGRKPRHAAAPEALKH